MKNLEIKARVKSLKVQEGLFRQLGARFVRKGRQIDTYFFVLRGRLKLRKLSSKNSKLVFYERKENSNQRWSDYFTFHISQPDRFNEFLKRALGVKVVVDKIRTLYRYENAKIHLDKVTNLGEFIEIEVEVKKDTAQAKNLMAKLLRYLKIPQKDFIKKSYSDLLLMKAKS